jgi:DMSO/TMAO reductase YedYZ molybdopterin-dependent catalytic subunit
MKPTLIFSLTVFCCTALAQTTEPVTDEFVVTGQIKSELKFTLADLEKFPSKPLPDVTITNHLGEPRGKATQLSGILLRDMLKGLELAEESPKRFSEFYFVFVAADNYKVAYSWNEIFNSPTGDNLFIITARDGKSLRAMTDRILVLTPTDFKTGRRHIKALSKIVVNRVN